MNIFFPGKPLSRGAIAWGVAADIAGSTLVGFVIGIILGFVMGMVGTTSGDIASIGKQPAVQCILFLIGVGMTVLGGWVSAYKAAHHPVSHALWCGIVIEAIGLLTSGIPLFLSLVKHPEAVEVGMAIRTLLALVVTIPAAYVGGVLLARYRARNAKTAASS